jgi:O-antigen ligase
VGIRHELSRAPFPAGLGWIGALPVLVTFVGVTAVGLDGGGLLPRTWRFALLAVLALTAAALIGRDRIALGRRDWIVMGALAGFVAWNAASKYWSELPADALPEAERNLLYLTCVAAVLFGVDRSSLPALLGGTLAGVTAASAYGLVDYMVSRPPLNPFQGELLFEPIGYANALGIYAALGIVLAVGLALSAPTRPLRVGVLAPLVVLAPTLYLTSSRGAWVVLPIGVVTVLFVGGHVRSRVVLGSLLLVGVAVGVLLGSGSDQALSLLGESRPRYWSVAWKDVQEHPLLGSGAGTFGNFWLHHPASGGYAHDAHNLYLESLAELGPLGLVLVSVALGAPLLALRRRQDAVTAAAAGAYVAFVLHAAVDWDWEFAAVALTGVICGAAVLVGTRPPRTEAMSPGVRAGLLGLVLLLAAFVVYRLAISEQLWLALASKRR